MKDAQRKVSPHRLYKLTKWIVFITSSILMVLGLISYKNGYLQQNIDSMSQACNQDYYSESCKFFLNYVGSARAAMNREFEIGIFLPILFFGTTALYKFLFPKADIE